MCIKAEGWGRKCMTSTSTLLISIHPNDDSVNVTRKHILQTTTKFKEIINKESIIKKVLTRTSLDSYVAQCNPAA